MQIREIDQPSGVLGQIGRLHRYAYHQDRKNARLAYDFRRQAQIAGDEFYYGDWNEAACSLMENARRELAYAFMYETLAYGRNLPYRDA